MRDPSRAEPIRATVAALICTALTATLAGTTADLVDDALRAGAALDRPVAAIVVGLGAAAAAVLAGGCWLLVVGNAARRLAGAASWCDRVGARLTPALLRRVIGLSVGAGLGVAALGGIASASEPDLGWQITGTAADTASAAPTSAEQRAPDAPEEETPEPTTIPAVTGTPGPEEPDGGPLASPAIPLPDLSEAAAGTVTVRRGDSLWRIAAAHLGGASDGEIAAAWPRWYETNREVIGPDPGLIHPGQVLRVPSDATSRPAP